MWKTHASWVSFTPVCSGLPLIAADCQKKGGAYDVCDQGHLPHKSESGKTGEPVFVGGRSDDGETLADAVAKE